MAAAIEGVTDNGNSLLTAISSSNFFISILLGGSLQQLWGLIRSMQFMILMLLIRVPLAGHAFKFFEGCSIIAQVDIFDGKDFYVNTFTITEAPPLNENYELMGISGLNFLINSGSFFVFFFAVFAFQAINKILSIIAKLQSHRLIFRKLGIAVY